MRFIENIFTDDTVLDIDYAVKCLKDGVAVINTYVVACHEKSGKMEIISSFNLLGGHKNNDEKVILAVSGGKYSAYRLFASMVEYGVSKGWKAEELGLKLIKE